MRIAIVGTGISGMVAAWLLRDLDLVVYEADERIGGHTHTVRIDDPAGPANVDTGFIVYNERNYPNFTKLLAKLGVATQPSEMSFSVRDESGGLEYMATGLNALFVQRRNLLRPGHYRMLWEILRFFRQAPALLREDPSALTLGDYVRARGYSADFVERHLIPMGAAIWSADPRQFRDFPAAYFVRFCANHGMLRVFGRPAWRVIAGGSINYAMKLVAPVRNRVRLATPVTAVRRYHTHVEVSSAGDGTQRFDQVILATHSDQALRILADPSPAEQAVLGTMAYQPNDVVLHTDTRLMPKRRRAWASWNYHLPAEPAACATMTYHMNTLQGLGTERDYCVTLNSTPRIDPARLLRRFAYHHPVYTVQSVAAQRRHAEISGVNRTHFCGAYWGYGFHEDGVNSALAVARHFGREL